MPTGFLTTVGTGSGTPLQIVCGAPNVAAGQKVWVATVGTVLFPSGAEKPLEIGKAKVRGEISEGMICAEDELGLGTDHSGILVLPDGVTPGTAASEYYHVTEDDVLEIELTPNRSDAISHLGVARDLAAWLAVHDTPVALQLPPGKESAGTAHLPVTVEVRNSEACPRYCGLVISGVNIGESPAWLQNKLRTIGVRPINTVVDVTNFILHEMGQPLHAFDMDTIEGGHVIVQTLSEGTHFTTLDGIERRLSAEDLMICDGRGKGMCIAGVYGGIGTGIAEHTQNIFLESAHFDPLWIRRTSMRHDLRTDAARTFEKSTDPNICRDALLRAGALISELAGGHIASPLVDVYPEPITPRPVVVRWKMISVLTGAGIDRQQALNILKALDMKVEREDEDTVTVLVPTNKADVTREADVIEEILRIYGYDDVPIPGKLEIALNAAPPTTMNALRQDLGDFLAALGFLETMGLSLLESRQYEAGPLRISEEHRILIENTSNISLDLMRHTMLASAMDAVRFNQNRMQQDLMLFEFGKIYQRRKGEIVEEEKLTLSVTGDPLPQSWLGATFRADFFFLKKYVYLLLGHLGIRDVESIQVTDNQWAYGLALHRDERQICVFGEVNPALTRQYDVRQALFYAEFDLQTVASSIQGKGLHIAEISKFPAVHRDIAIIVNSAVQYSDIEKAILSSGGKLLTDVSLFDLYENAEMLGAEKRSLAIALIFQDPGRTLTDEEVNKAVSGIVSGLGKETGATLRS